MRWTQVTALVAMALVLLPACDPEKEERQRQAAAKAQAVADSLAEVYQHYADSMEAAIAADSVTMALDSSGAWNIEEPGEDIIAEEVEVADQGFTYEQWRHVADDTVAVTRRHFDEAALAEYLDDPDLDYDKVIHHDNLWWDRFMRWLGDKLEDIFGSDTGEVIFDNLHWVLLGVAVLVVVWFLRRHLFVSVFGLGAKRARQVTEIEENIAELDLEPLLRAAEKSGNWRLALRYQWLKVLRRLVDEGRIKWQPRFTDADYLAQLKDPAMRVTFSELSFLFKWVWYGDAPMDAQRYQRLKPSFEAAQRSTVARAEHAPAAAATTP